MLVIFHVYEVLFVFIVNQRGTRDHWVNHLHIFKQNHVNVFENDPCIKIVVAIIFRQRDTKAYICQKC